MLIDEVNVSNVLGVSINKNSHWASELSQSHLVEKIIIHVGLEVFMSFKAREAPAGKLLLHKGKYNLGSKCVCNCSTTGQWFIC